MKNHPKGAKWEKVVHKGKGPRAEVKRISMMKAHKLLGKGYEGFLCNVMTTEGAEPFLQDIPVVREFPDVFLHPRYMTP